MLWRIYWIFVLLMRNLWNIFGKSHKFLVARVTRKHSSRMCTAHFSDFRGLPTETLPGQRPWTEKPPAQRPPLTETPCTEKPPCTETPYRYAWDHAARQEVTSYRDFPVDRQTPVKILPCPKLPFGSGKNP